MWRFITCTLASILCALAVAIPVGASSALIVSQSGQDELDIVVEGTRAKRRQAVREFAKAVTRRPRVDLPVERFRLPVCPLVYGIKPQYARIITKRINQNARGTALSVAREKGCKPNIYVLFVRDIDVGIKRMQEEGGVMFEHLLDYQIDRVMKETGPVRSWNVSEIRDERGIPLPFDPTIGTGAYVNKPGAATRLRLAVTMETMAAIVVIDVSALNGKSLTQLADYATMRVLAPTHGIGDPQDARFETILTLFAEERAPSGMTPFDHAYLRTIYASPASLYPDDLYQRVAAELERGDKVER